MTASDFSELPPLPDYWRKFREDFDTSLHRHSEHFEKVFKNWAHRHESHTEETKAWQRRLETRLEDLHATFTPQGRPGSSQHRPSSSNGGVPVRSHMRVPTNCSIESVGADAWVAGAKHFDESPPRRQWTEVPPTRDTSDGFFRPPTDPKLEVAAKPGGVAAELLQQQQPQMQQQQRPVGSPPNGVQRPAALHLPLSEINGHGRPASPAKPPSRTTAAEEPATVGANMTGSAATAMKAAQRRMETPLIVKDAWEESPERPTTPYSVPSVPDTRDSDDEITLRKLGHADNTDDETGIHDKNLTRHDTRRSSWDPDIVGTPSFFGNGTMRQSLSNLLRRGGGRKNRTTVKKHKPSQFLIAKKVQEMQEQESCIQKIVYSRLFEWTSTTVVLLNAVFIGYQVQHVASGVDDNWRAGLTGPGEPSSIYFTLQNVFCLVFLMELCLRWGAEGFTDFLDPFNNPSLTWNIFDIFIVTIGVVEFFWEIAQPGSTGASFSVIRVLRVLRIAKVVRVIRVLKFFHELRIMIDSIIGSLKVFAWAVMVLFVLFYVFGISMTSSVAEYIAAVDPDQMAFSVLDSDHPLRLMSWYFGTLPRSMNSLFSAMSGGRDWIEYYEVLEPLPTVTRAQFLLFIAFSLFAVVNVVTGVFVESAIQTSGSDRESLIKEEMDQKSRYLQNMQDVFLEMDADGTGGISLDEFEEHLADTRVIAYFNALKLDVSDARMLFRLLDSDHSGAVEIEEFLLGCDKLKGEARSLDVASMRVEIADLRRCVMSFFDQLGLIDAGSEKALNEITV
eukprot:TRINITY_DN4934_c0_g1_i2.p1 TRINITY_DN4934_c0_g1~~TRINITY_DN4934_c0_g1_i2.p1  ORF type:complete len:787 (-),score=174.68 TRINITY_DN4934_c0_g1_i2:126-2486(-)